MSIQNNQKRKKKKRLFLSGKNWWKQGKSRMTYFTGRGQWQSEQATPEIPPERSDPWQTKQLVGPSLAILAP